MMMMIIVVTMVMTMAMTNHKDNDFDDDDDDESMPDKTLPGLTCSCCFKIKLVKLRKKFVIRPVRR